MPLSFKHNIQEISPTHCWSFDTVNFHKSLFDILLNFIVLSGIHSCYVDKKPDSVVSAACKRVWCPSLPDLLTIRDDRIGLCSLHNPIHLLFVLSSIKVNWYLIIWRCLSYQAFDLLQNMDCAQQFETNVFNLSRPQTPLVWRLFNIPRLIQSLLYLRGSYLLHDQTNRIKSCTESAYQREKVSTMPAESCVVHTVTRTRSAFRESRTNISARNLVSFRKEPHTFIQVKASYRTIKLSGLSSMT